MEFINNEQLRTLCIKNNWFTCGTNEQYDKLFDANSYPSSSLRDIATMIYICSENVALCEIIAILEKENKVFISLEGLEQSLFASFYGDLEINVIINALRYAESASEYRLI